MAACIVNLSSLLPDCAAFTSVSGVRDFFFACRRADITGVTQAEGASVTAVTITATKLKKVLGRKFQNSGAFDATRNAVGKARFKQTFTARVYYRDQVSRTAMEQFALVEDLVIFSPNNDSQIEIYGLSLGLTPTSLKGGTGVKLDDDNTALFVFEGDEPHLPVIYNTVIAGGSTPAVEFLANLAVLDALVGA